MCGDRIQHQTSDVLSAEGIDGQQRNTASDTASFPRFPKPVLPNNLPKAPGYLDDQDLDRLLGAAIEELKRRGRLPPGFEPSSAKTSTGSGKLTEKPSAPAMDSLADDNNKLFRRR